MSSVQLNRNKQHIASAVIMGGFPPLMILAHEMGHYLVAKSYGYQVRLMYAEVFILTPGGMPDFQSLWITLAGPLVELTMTAIGLWWIFRNSRAEGRERGVVGVWIFTACSLAGFRWIKVMFDGKLSDEAHLSVMAGFHHLAIPILLLPLSFLSGWAVLRFHRRHQTMLPFGTGFCAGLVSALLWLYVVGPALLPYPEAQKNAAENHRQPGASAAAHPVENVNDSNRRPQLASDGIP